MPMWARSPLTTKQTSLPKAARALRNASMNCPMRCPWASRSEWLKCKCENEQSRHDRERFRVAEDMLEEHRLELDGVVLAVSELFLEEHATAVLAEEPQELPVSPDQPERRLEVFVGAGE